MSFEPIESVTFVGGAKRVRIRWRNGVERRKRIEYLEALQEQVRNELVVERMDAYLSSPVQEAA